MKKQGFTLAEVLVTLGIIGVVAAMTIPTLVNQTNDAEYKTGLKKIVSVLNQAVTMNYALHGVDFSEVTSATTGENDGDLSLAAIFLNRMNIIDKQCDGQNNLGGKGSACYTLNDGMFIAFSGSNCTSKESNCRVYVDLNGTKKPNRPSEKVSDDNSSSSEEGGSSNTGGPIGDRYVLAIYNQTVIPADSPAEYIMYGKYNGNTVTKEWSSGS